jgi:hypothetical protein
MNRISQLARWLRGRKHATGSAPWAPGMIRNLLWQVAHTQEQEYDCAEVYRELDELAELAAQDADAATRFALALAHLEKCGDCREEYMALMRIVQATRA